jgi:protein-arginine kinase
MILFSQPAHLQKRRGHELEPAERDLVRGEYLRGRLSEAEKS